MSDLSYYSKEFGGTFHFMQFNMLNKEEFFASKEFKHFMKFVLKSYPQLQSLQKLTVNGLSNGSYPEMEQHVQTFRDFVDQI